MSIITPELYSLAKLSLLFFFVSLGVWVRGDSKTNQFYFWESKSSNMQPIWLICWGKKVMKGNLDGGTRSCL